MPRDMTGSGRYAPQPRYPPFAFYTAVRVGDPEMLEKIMRCDPYFITQDNGAGAPLHFAVTYRHLDMVTHCIDWYPSHLKYQMQYIETASSTIKAGFVLPNNETHAYNNSELRLFANHCHRTSFAV